MKIVALGDIHSNYLALEACMRWIYQNDVYGIAFLGDYVTDCPYPERTMQIIKNIPYAYKTWFVRGNREDYLLNHKLCLTEPWEYNSQSGSLLYTYESLTGSDLRFFEDMPIGMEVKIDGYPPFNIAHASLQDNKMHVKPSDEEALSKAADEMTTFFMACGHCHEPFTYTKGKKTIVNAGSVGIPCNGKTEAEFVVLESNGGDWSAKHMTVPYDTEAVVSQFEESGLKKKADVWSRCVIAALRTGRNYQNECVKLVRKLSEQRSLAFSDESLWQEAAEELGI